MKLLSSRQTEIMIAIWDAQRPLKRSEIQQLLTEREWKTPTLNTFLAKLVELGFLRIEHDRRDYVYHPLVSKKEYLALEGQERMKKLYGSSLETALGVLCPIGTATKEQIEALEQYLKILKGEKQGI